MDARLIAREFMIYPGAYQYRIADGQTFGFSVAFVNDFAFGDVKSLEKTVRVTEFVVPFGQLCRERYRQRLQ